MIFASIEGWSGGWDKLTPEQYAELREHMALPEEKPQYAPHAAIWMDRDALRACARFEIVIRPAEDSNTNTMLVKLADRVGSLETATAERVAEGSAVTIAIPDIGLMTVRRVDVLCDACTDQLQTYLDNGWRLLAVCPPNAQRRPDYVLGHHSKDAE